MTGTNFEEESVASAREGVKQNGLLTKLRAYAQAGVTLLRDPYSIRFFPRWFKTLHRPSTPLNDRLPWMVFKAFRWLDSYLKSPMIVFEYGTGGSTIFIAKRVRKLISVEHNPHWYEAASRALSAEGITNCELRLVPGQVIPAGTEVPYGPWSFTSLSYDAEGQSLEAYVRSIEEFPDRSFDLVIIDGVARPSCIPRAIPKVRPGGYLYVGDTDDPVYQTALRLLEQFPRTMFEGVTPFQVTPRQSSIWKL